MPNTLRSKIEAILEDAEGVSYLYFKKNKTGIELEMLLLEEIEKAFDAGKEYAYSIALDEDAMPDKEEYINQLK